ncbi:hypothetical protein ACHAQJ_005420 [Trichoderma viride]
MGRGDKTYLSEVALRMISNDGETMLSFKKKSITRSQAMALLQPIIGRRGTATDFTTEIETTFTRETVKVLPQTEKAAIGWAAQAAGNEKVQEWIASARDDDMEEYRWTVAVDIPKGAAYQARAICTDLKTVARYSLPDVQILLLVLAQRMRTLFESQEQRYRELRLVTPAEIPQIMDSIAEFRRLMEEQRVGKRTHEGDQVGQKTPTKRRAGRARRFYARKCVKFKGLESDMEI